MHTRSSTNPPPALKALKEVICHQLFSVIVVFWKPTRSRISSFSLRSAVICHLNSSASCGLMAFFRLSNCLFKGPPSFCFHLCCCWPKNLFSLPATAVKQIAISVKVSSMSHSPLNNTLC